PVALVVEERLEEDTDRETVVAVVAIGRIIGPDVEDVAVGIAVALPIEAIVVAPVPVPAAPPIAIVPPPVAAVATIVVPPVAAVGAGPPIAPVAAIAAGLPIAAIAAVVALALALGLRGLGLLGRLLCLLRFALLTLLGPRLVGLAAVAAVMVVAAPFLRAGH